MTASLFNDPAIRKLLCSSCLASCHFTSLSKQFTCPHIEKHLAKSLNGPHSLMSFTICAEGRTSLQPYSEETMKEVNLGG